MEKLVVIYFFYLFTLKESINTNPDIFDLRVIAYLYVKTTELSVSDDGNERKNVHCFI